MSETKANPNDTKMSSEELSRFNVWLNLGLVTEEDRSFIDNLESNMAEFRRHYCTPRAGGKTTLTCELIQSTLRKAPPSWA